VRVNLHLMLGAENHDPIESQTRLGAVPVNKLINGTAIPALAIGTGQAFKLARH
jgi:hypothetical protein